MFIPKNTVVLPNLWYAVCRCKTSMLMLTRRAMLRDETLYENPHTFNPERFLASDGQINPDVLHPRMITFGFGRRRCPGVSLAETSIWLSVATLLAAFEIRRATDASGREIVPSGEMTGGALR